MSANYRRTFQALSYLLLYPQEESCRYMHEVMQAIREEGMIKGEPLKRLAALTEELQHGDIYELQERYVTLFDRTRSVSLHLFEHVHGESRDRGQAMVDLLEHYQQHGYALSASELPDYLPLFLEFLSLVPFADALELLSQPQAILEAIGGRLKERRSPYAAVFDALLAIAGSKPARVAKDAEEPPLDKTWEDAPVNFMAAPAPTAAVSGCGGGGHGCGCGSMTANAQA